MLRLRSPAKINLFLKIISKRADGFHELASLFQAIDLFDYITIQTSDQDTFTCSNPHLPTDGSNLVIKSLNLYRQKTGISTPVSIHLDKHIPAEAGLGGGSSNAATTLWALNELFNRTATLDQLQTWSAKIGSDITFFLSHGTAYCTGRGELIQEQPPLPTQSLWIVKPPFGLPTPSVYKNLSLAAISKDDPESLLRDFYAGKPRYVNDLEIPAFQLLPQLASLKQQLNNLGCQATMSGSGTSFFCIGDLPSTFSQDYLKVHSSFINRSNSLWY